MKNRILYAFVLFLTVFPVWTSSVNAQELSLDRVTTMKAEVIEIVSKETDNVPGTNVESIRQVIRVKVLDGPEEGRVIKVEDDHIGLKLGDVFYLMHTVNALEGFDMYAVSEPYRLPWLYGFIAAFVLCVIIFGGKQGFRGLIALALSFIFIIYLLLPGILRGFSPVLVSMGVASLIVILGSYVTHGLNRVTTSAVFGMVLTILVTGGLAFVAISGAQLTGFSDEESVYLNIGTGGSIDFAGLLLGGILIGLLGVLYDAAIGQAVAVDELHNVGPHLSRAVIFKRAIRIGREHIGALVNTLAIAYVGASLPLLLLFYQSSAEVGLTVNMEIFAAEIIRTMIGSIGLVLAVPTTTVIAIFMLVRKHNTGAESPALIASEMRRAEEMGHHH